MAKEFTEVEGTSITFIYPKTNDCPHCGRCPTCGRGGYQTQPCYPSYPPWQIPYCGSTSIETSPSQNFTTTYGRGGELLNSQWL